MKQIKIKFVGFWPGFDESDNFIINILKKRYQVDLSDDPDYIISSCFSDEHLEYDCVKIFYTGENICPDFNAFDYAIGYEFLKFDDRYIRLPNYYITDTYADDVRRMMEKHLKNENILNNKNEFCSFVVSKGDGYVDSEREKFFHLLNRYKKVNSGGRFLNNIGKPQGVEDKLVFQMCHKFAIAFENVSHKGYTTEKIVQAFAAKTVPIYWGSPMVTETFSAKAFINCHDFATFDDVVERVKEIDNNDSLYISMLNTPALREESVIRKKQSELVAFFNHIFDQKYEEAFRRDRVGYGKKHCDQLKRYRKIEGNKWSKFLFRFIGSGAGENK